MLSATGLRDNGRGFVLALLCSSAFFQGTDSAGKLLPSISSPLVYRPLFGEKLSVSCEGYSAYPSSGIIYWLANGTFVEDVYPEDAVREKDAVEKVNGTGLSLKRELVFYSLTPKDLHQKFECIILDPAGHARKAITWETPDPSGSGSKAAKPRADGDKGPKNACAKAPRE